MPSIGTFRRWNLPGGKLDLGKSADGAETAIGSALDDVLRRETGKRLAGVILLSDGAQQAFAPRDLQPQLPARRLNDLPAPLFTVTFGQDRSASQSRDVAITDLVVQPERVHQKRIERGRHGAYQRAGESNRFPCKCCLKPRRAKWNRWPPPVLRAKQNGEQIKFELSYIPQTPGERKLTLRAEPQAGERITTNNELSTFVNVLDGGLNVLYLEGEPRVEQKFIRRSLASSPDIKVDFQWIDDRDRQHWPINLADQVCSPANTTCTSSAIWIRRHSGRKICSSCATMCCTARD